MCAVSVGVARGGAVEVGAVYDPFTNELFSARRGEGAYLNGKLLRTPGAPSPPDLELEDAAVAVGFPSAVSHKSQVTSRNCHPSQLGLDRTPKPSLATGHSCREAEPTTPPVSSHKSQRSKSPPRRARQGGDCLGSPPPEIAHQTSPNQGLCQGQPTGSRLCVSCKSC